MDYHQTHRIVSELFFLTGWLIPAIFSLSLLTAPRPGFSHWLLAPGSAVVAVSLTFIAIYSTYRPANPDGPIVDRPAGFWSVPFFEWASLVSIIVWLVCVSVVLLREHSE
jgi:succinate dehydrogenase hydrophobic anchor subunit